MKAGVTEAAGVAKPPVAPRKNWHRFRLLLAALAGLALAAAVAIYGFDYYTLDTAHRIGSPKHARLKPSGGFGHPLGILGGLLFLLIFLYPLRKRWAWLGKRGKTKHWLDFHILMGLAAPLIITFHSAFKLRGVAGLAYWIMMSVVASGIVGRYFYGQIPRRLDAAEMSFQEMQAASEQLAGEFRFPNALPAEDVAQLFLLPSASDVQSMSLAAALWRMVVLDLRRVVLLGRLKRKARAAGFDSRELEKAFSAASRLAALSKEILFLSKAQRIFHLWHVVHRPFSYSFALLSALHVLIVLLLGYY